MNDQDKLEAVTGGFTSLILKNQFNDPWFYAELAKRLVTIIDAEIRFNADRELKEMQLTAWGHRAN